MQSVEELLTKLLGLAHIPVATVTAVAGIILVVWAYAEGNLSLQDAFQSVGILLGGAGILGHARNGSGRGLHL